MPTAYEDTLVTLLDAHPEVLVLTAENRAAIRTLEMRAPGRLLDFGIAEQTMVGAAAGLALRGYKPVAHALAAFLTMRAFEFIRTDVGIAGLPVKLVGYVPGFLSEANGPTHQAIEDIALMRSIPGMQIYCPSDRDELCAALPEIIARPEPCYVRYHDVEAATPHGTPYAPGRAEAFGNPGRVALLSYGLMLAPSLEAAKLLAQQGVTASVIDVRTLVPLDERTLLRVAAETELLVTVEDHFLVGGLHSALSELLLRSGLRTTVLPIALDGRWFAPALLPDVLTHEGFDGAGICGRVLAALKRGAN